MPITVSNTARSGRDIVEGITAACRPIHTAGSEAPSPAAAADDPANRAPTRSCGRAHAHTPLPMSSTPQIAPHTPSLETRLSLRTRFLEAFAAGYPVVATAGGTIGRLVAEHGAGWVVPPGDPAALAEALAAALGGGLEARRDAGRALAATFGWDRVMQPLVAFCREPWRDSTRERFAFRPATVAPPDPLAFRLRRRLRRAFELED